MMRTVALFAGAFLSGGSASPCVNTTTEAAEEEEGCPALEVYYDKSLKCVDGENGLAPPPNPVTDACLVCVANVTECPAELTCSSETPFLLADGSCAAENPCIDETENPCTAGVACAIASLATDVCEAHVESLDISIEVPEPCVICVRDPLNECPSNLKDACFLYSVYTPYTCPDGSCAADEASCPEDAENPCECGEFRPCGNPDQLTCDDVIAGMEGGQEAFDALPIPATDEDCEVWDWNKGHYAQFLVVVIGVATASILFCCFNQRCSNTTPPKVALPRGSTEAIELISPATAGAEHSAFSKDLVQTGFRSNSFLGALGTVLYWVNLAMVGYFHLLMILLSISYYTNDMETETWTAEPNYVQALFAFEIVWGVAAVWMVFFKWPNHLRSHFWARCALADAQNVRVWKSETRDLSSINADDRKMEEFAEKVAAFANSIFEFVFSDVNRPKGKGNFTVCPVTVSETGERYITFQLIRMVYSPSFAMYVPVEVSAPTTTEECLQQAQGLTSKEAATRRGRVGRNLIQVEAPSAFRVVIAEFSKGFYTYQAFMAWTWLNFTYWHMGIINTLVYSIGGLTVSYVAYKNLKTLHKLVEDKNTARVLRDGKLETIASADLVPGDVMELLEGPCTVDAVIIQGSAVMDESSLTGESTPVHKTCVDGVRQPNSKNVAILAGTRVIQGSVEGAKTLALVVKTGGHTAKGQQVAEILFRRPPMFRFDVQVKFVLALLVLWAIFGFFITLHFLAEEPVYAWFYGMYVVGSALPPLLPTVFVISVGIASSRLLKRGVIVTDPARLLVAGKVRLCCFDKTGTLTKEGMEFTGVCLCDEKTLSELEPKVPDGSQLQRGMACCHTLAQLADGGLVGTAVDKIMFQQTGFSLDAKAKEVKSADGEVTLVRARTFDFDHARQTSSVVVRDGKSGKHTIYVKGSAEAIGRVLDPKALPNGYAAAAEGYARAGCYTLALAFRAATDAEEKELAADEEKGDKEDTILGREAVESGLTLAGFMAFRNDLKPDSADAIARLQEGACRVVMLTGDHALTAVHIAKEVGMMTKGKAVFLSNAALSADGRLTWCNEKGEQVATNDDDVPDGELVVLGAAWRKLGRASQENLVGRVRVFARTSPDDKLNIVRLFVNMGVIVSMCGDGGNDCGALRAAHVGVALSDQEASVVSPFTGIDRSARGMVDVLLEGRACLASAIACYKYMLMYGVVETVNQIINAYFAVTFSEWCWVFMDGFWVVSMSFCLAFAKPAQKLSDERPPSSLLGWYTMSSFLGVFIIHFIFTVIALSLLNAQDFYQCRMWDPENSDLASVDAIGDNYESTVTFLVTGAQYFTTAMAFNFGHKHRGQWATNWRLLCMLTIFIVIHILVIFVPSRLSCLFRINCDADHVDMWSGRFLGPITGETCPMPIQNYWGTTMMPADFRLTLFLLILFNALAIILWEKGMLFGAPGNALRRWFRANNPGSNAKVRGLNNSSTKDTRVGL